jgi:16S rRNA (cytidine1402-2'-O)-methyltransferase
VIDNLGTGAEDLPLRAARILGEAAIVSAWDAGWLQERWPADVAFPPVLDLSGSAADRLRLLLDALRSGDVVWAHGGREGDVQILRALAERGVTLAALPGPAEQVAALAASGLPAARVTFLGSLPCSAQARQEVWRVWAQEPGTLVGIVPVGVGAALLAEVHAEWGERQVAAYRRGETWRGSTGDAAGLDWGGPFFLVIGQGAGPGPWSGQRVEGRVRALLARGVSPRDAAREVAGASGWSRRDVYDCVLRVRGEPGRDRGRERRPEG